jgi:hypothetical protein
MPAQFRRLLNRYGFPALATAIAMGFCLALNAQQNLDGRAIVVRMSSTHSSFPDTGRALGHTYDSVLYDQAAHYSDSSVLMVLPARFKPQKTLDLVFWFHGWRNNIDTALSYYHLLSQFEEANRQAILVLAEAAKNAPDSYGGKLENPGVFAALVGDVLIELKRRQLVPAKAEDGHIMLAGHSGAYRVIAKILQNGGVQVQEVVLFDALYGETDSFDRWIHLDSNNRFINWYTNEGGGTDQVSLAFMDQLKKEGLPYGSVEEGELRPRIIRTNRILFVHSPREHNDIIFNPDNFRLVLENTSFLKPLDR